MSTMRDRARQLFAEACTAADPAAALLAALADAPLPQPDESGRIILLAIGKAAIPMAEALLSHLDHRPARTVIVTNRENVRDIAGADLHVAGHPVPDAGGEKAAYAVEAALADTTASDRVIALISGGGSALLPAPVAGVTLSDKAETNRLLLGAGLDITRFNLVRQSLSRLKGGGLLRAAAPAPVTAYILSDVIGDDLRVVASGLTVGPVGSRSDACTMLIKEGLFDRLPQAVQQALAREDERRPLPPARNILIGSNRKSLERVLAVAGARAEIRSDSLTGDVAEAAAQIVADAQAIPGPCCLIYGGETTVTLKGQGLGGRNQELALRVAADMPETAGPFVFLSGGTDGRDGPTEAAGGLVDNGTIDRIRAAGGDVEALLADNDSHRALALAGDLLITGATGTNVADIQILLKS